MKKEYVLLSVLCLLLLSTSPSVVGYADEVVERPIYSEGDYWIFIDAKGESTEWRFLREENNKYVFSTQGSEVVKDFNLMDMSKPPTLSASLRKLGPDYPDVATSLETMADLYRKTGREKDAEAFEQRVKR